MLVKMLFSCYLLPPNSISNLFQCFQNLIQRRAVELVVAAIDVAHRAAAVVVATNYQSGRVGDVEGVGAERMMEPVSFGHGPILIKQKDAGDGMLLQEISRFPHAIPLFGRNERQLCSRCFNFLSSRLELSHALHAVRSPGAAQKLENQGALLEQPTESECALTIGRCQGKVRGSRSDFQSFGAVLHVEFDCKRGGMSEQ